MGESVLTTGGISESVTGIGAVLGKEPTPEFAVQMNEQCAQLLDDLHDGSLRTVALFKLEGYSNEEIAQQLGYDRRTIERKVKKIQQRWAAVSQAE